jgi:chaperone modulatory protein CbpM
MTQRHYTLTETLALVDDLGAEQLARYIRAGVVAPVQSEEGPLFRDLDLARLSLVVDLAEGYHLDEEALAMVLSLVDQLHGLRGDMRAMLDAVACEPVETRMRLKAAIRDVRVIRQD